MADALGLKQEQIASVWNTNREDQQAEVSDGECLTQLIPEFLSERDGKWRGTSADLLEGMNSDLEIEKRANRKSFPKTAEHLGRRLGKIIENLFDRGISIIKKKGVERMVTPRYCCSTLSIYRLQRTDIESPGENVI